VEAGNLGFSTWRNNSIPKCVNLFKTSRGNEKKSKDIVNVTTPLPPVIRVTTGREWGKLLTVTALFPKEKEVAFVTDFALKGGWSCPRRNLKLNRQSKSADEQTHGTIPLIYPERRVSIKNWKRTQLTVKRKV